MSLYMIDVLDKLAVILFIVIIVLLITLLIFSVEYSIRSMEFRVTIALVLVVSAAFVLIPNASTLKAEKVKQIPTCTEQLSSPQ